MRAKFFKEGLSQKPKGQFLLYLYSLKRLTSIFQMITNLLCVNQFTQHIYEEVNKPIMDASKCLKYFASTCTRTLSDQYIHMAQHIFIHQKEN